jgi:IclR family acetate operon transcriptional repressor
METGATVSEPEARGTLGTVRNAALLLTLLSEGPAYQQLTDLAERSGLSVPTVHRLLRSLVLAGLVEQDPASSRYGLGPELVRLSHRYLARLPVLSALAPYLVPLRDAVQATVHIAVLVRAEVVYVDRVDSTDGGLYRQPHRVHAALATAAGRLLIARADDDAWKQALQDATPEQRRTAESARDEWRGAQRLRSDDADPSMQPELAVPVCDARQAAVGALAATLPPDLTGRQLEDLAAQLTRAAKAAGRTLGHA